MPNEWLYIFLIPAFLDSYCWLSEVGGRGDLAYSIIHSKSQVGWLPKTLGHIIKNIFVSSNNQIYYEVVEFN